MTSAFGKMVLAVAGGAVLAVGAFAQTADQKGTNAAARMAQPRGTSGVAEFNSAMEQAATARSLRDPMMMASAARRVLAVGGIAANDPGTTGAADAAKPAGGSAATKPADTRQIGQRLLDEAKAMAGGNAAALAYAAEVAAGAGRGTQVGPHRHTVDLQAGRYIEYTETFRGGQLAEAGLVGDGDTDVDLKIIDQNGNVICESTRNGDREYCSWTPAWTGTFKVQLTNYGRVYNAVTLVVN